MALRLTLAGSASSSVSSDSSEAVTSTASAFFGCTLNATSSASRRGAVLGADATLVDAAAAVAGIWSLNCWRIHHCCDVERKLLMTQYTPRPAGTWSANHPIMSGRNLRICCVCCCAGSSLAGGWISFCDAVCVSTRITGSDRYASVASHPSAGCPSVQPLNSHAEASTGRPVFKLYSPTGPWRDGIQRKLSSSMSFFASSSTERYSPMKTGIWTSVGRHPASGFTSSSLYSCAVFSFIVCGSLAYRACSAFSFGCIACIWIVDAICL
mmetsp:Transcript_42633/g.85366  ORF Transcript_42633/g.85366 Transcript_42633/m.85366 type:complete len:268 (-) Transcript_42633:281-1084(-)